MLRPIIFWISIVMWLGAVLVLFATQGNEIANAAVLILSFWLMYWWWMYNRKQKRFTWIKLP